MVGGLGWGGREAHRWQHCTQQTLLAWEVRAASVCASPAARRAAPCAARAAGLPPRCCSTRVFDALAPDVATGRGAIVHNTFQMFMSE